MITPFELAEALGTPLPTAEQAAVIAAPAEPILVIAGAGSGKTETMAARVVYLVANGLVSAEQVLGLTFTRKAATELGQRIRRRLATLATTGIASDHIVQRHAGLAAAIDPEISTYHAFAGRLVSEFGPLIGIEPPRTILTPTASWQLAREVVGSWDDDLDTDLGTDRVTADLLAISGALADHLRQPEDLQAVLAGYLDTLATAAPSARQRSPMHSKLVPVRRQLADRAAIVGLVTAYDEAKRARNALDFADQMQLAARVCRASPVAVEIIRSRAAVVLLDEYQDTGYAQRIILRSLFGAQQRGGGAPARAAHPVMAVGDPVQSIYGWRGASASNLPKFTTDFPRSDGARARTLELLTSFRNASRVLMLANGISAPLRESPVPVGQLRSRPGADDGDIRVALAETVDDEDEHLAASIAAIYRGSDPPPSVAVLLRRRADMPAVAQRLRDHGLPVEIVGVGGLLDEPEVADLVAMLRMVADHQSGPAAIRILTGARWRLGIADIAALFDRARQLRAGDHGSVASAATVSEQTDAQMRLARALGEAVAGEDIDSAGLVDALADPGEPTRYSHVGFHRIQQLRGDLEFLRTRLLGPLPDLITDIEHTVGLDIEMLMTERGRVHLDAFAEVVADIAITGAGPIELLDYLATAAEREDGLASGHRPSQSGAIQLMTVHGAKGLEWDVVAIPHLCRGVFPSERNTTWLGSASSLPPPLREDDNTGPAFTFPSGVDQGELASAVTDHVAALAAQGADEERRLMYVALTRAKRTLLLSAHHWGRSGVRPKGPSGIFTEIMDVQAASIPKPDLWASPPDADAVNPLLDNAPTGIWPADPLAAARSATEQGADLVRDYWGAATLTDDDIGVVQAPNDDVRRDDPDHWQHTITLLLTERAAKRQRHDKVDVALPEQISTSDLVSIASDSQQYARRLFQPLPTAPAPQARRGTAFHAWVEHRFGGEPLLDIDQLPGAHDHDAGPDAALRELIEAFLGSEWASRSPLAVEVAIRVRIAGVDVRGRVDAVYSEGDGYRIVDWKTGQPPTGARARAVAVQLAVYRLAWSQMHHVPVEQVHASFYYVASKRTVSPADLLDKQGLTSLITDATVVAGAQT